MGFDEDFDKLAKEVMVFEKTVGLPLVFSIIEYAGISYIFYLIYTHLGRDYCFIVLAIGVIMYGINNKMFKR